MATTSEIHEGNAMKRKDDNRDKASLAPQVFLSTDAIGRLFRYLMFCKRHKRKIGNPAKARQKDISSLLVEEKSYEDNHLVSDGWNLMNKLLLIQEASDHHLALFTSEMVRHDFQLLVLEDCRERKLARDFVRPPAYSRLQYCQLNDVEALASANGDWDSTMEGLQDHLNLGMPVYVVGYNPAEMDSIAPMQRILGTQLIIDPSELNMYVCALVEYVDFVVTYDAEFGTLLSNLRDGEDWALTADVVTRTVLQYLPAYSSYASHSWKKGVTKQQLRQVLPRAGNATRLGSLFAQHLLDQPPSLANRWKRH
jgi:hypothetical protein